MDYIVFATTANGNIIHVGTINNARSFQDAKKRLLSKPAFKRQADLGNSLYLVRAENFIKVRR